MTISKDQCWRCKKWVRFSENPLSANAVGEGRLGLCKLCWSALRSVLLIIVLFIWLMLSAAITVATDNSLVFLSMLFAPVVIYIGIYMVRYLDESGWFDFIDYLKQKRGR